MSIILENGNSDILISTLPLKDNDGVIRMTTQIQIRDRKRMLDADGGIVVTLYPQRHEVRQLAVELEVQDQLMDAYAKKFNEMLVKRAESQRKRLEEPDGKDSSKDQGPSDSV